MTTQALYCVSRVPDWIDFACILQERLDWHPAYWVTLPENHASVCTAFPDIVAHPFVDLNRGLAPAGGDWFEGEMSSDDLARAAPFEAVALQMLDRIDLGRTFHEAERRRFFRRLLAHWRGAIAEFDLGIAIFNVPPHALGEYAAYAAFRMQGLRTRIFRPTPVENLHVVCDTVEELPADVKRAYQEKLAGSASTPGPKVAAHCNKLRTTSLDYRPWYVEDLAERSEKRRSVSERIEAAMAAGELVPAPLEIGRPVMSLRAEKTGKAVQADNLLKRTRKPKHDELVRQVYKLPDRPLSGSLMNKWEYLLYRDWAMVQKIALRKQYEERVAPVDFETDYVYFAMHYQPKRTTCPDGGLFNDQLRAIALLSEALPKGWRLYVKEHPSQFGFHGMGELSRWSGYYDEVARHPNVSLVPLDTSSLALVDGARAVATITGAVGWEALNRGKPALCFGAAWYGPCRGAYLITEPKDASDAFARIAAGALPKFEDVLAYAATLEDLGEIVFTNPSLEKAVETDQDLAETLARLIERFEERLSERGECRPIQHDESGSGSTLA